jgi:hypothetical protein
VGKSDLEVRLEMVVYEGHAVETQRELFRAERNWHSLDLDQVRAMGNLMPEVLERLTAVAEGRVDERR